MEKLAPVNVQLLESADLIKGLVANSTTILNQVRATKVLVQGNEPVLSVSIVEL